MPFYMRELSVVVGYSGQRRRSRRRGPDGQEMRNLSKQQMVEVAGPHWSDDESDIPPSKRARDTGYASDHTVVTEYEDMWGQARAPHAILTPPSMVSIWQYYSVFGIYINQSLQTLYIVYITIQCYIPHSIYSRC